MQVFNVVENLTWFQLIYGNFNCLLICSAGPGSLASASATLSASATPVNLGITICPGRPCPCPAFVLHKCLQGCSSSTSSKALRARRDGSLLLNTTESSPCEGRVKRFHMCSHVWQQLYSTTLFIIVTLGGAANRDRGQNAG